MEMLLVLLPLVMYLLVDRYYLWYPDHSLDSLNLLNSVKVI